MRCLHLLASLAALALLPAGASERAWAQADVDIGFPSKPIRFVVGYAAGGGNDIFARLVGDKLREFLGQPVVIENKRAAEAGSPANTSWVSRPTATPCSWVPPG